MEIKGTIVEVLEPITGQGANGEWRKQSYVLELPGAYPKKVCFDVWGNNIDAFQVKPQEELTVSIDIESREYNGKWYTNVKAWRIQRGETAPPAQTMQAATPTSTNIPNDAPPPEKASEPTVADFEDDLPF